MNRILEADVFLGVLEDEGLDEVLDRGVRTMIPAVDDLLEIAEANREIFYLLKSAISEAVLPYAEEILDPKAQR